MDLLYVIHTILMLVGTSLCVHTPTYWNLYASTTSSPYNRGCHWESLRKITETNCEVKIHCSLTAQTLPELIKNFKCNSSYSDLDEYPDDYTASEDVHVTDILLSISGHTAWTPIFGLNGLERLLKTLTIENGGLTSVPAKIYNYTNLHEVKLISNNINVINLNNFSRLTNLKKVNISNNLIEEIQTDSFLLDIASKPTTNIISILDLSRNLIITLPNNTFETFINIKHLNLSYNLIKNLNKQIFTRIVQLETLQLSNNQLMQIGDMLSDLVNLRELTIDYNKISIIDNANFRTQYKLENLNISHNRLIKIDDQAFRELTKLLELDLSYNNISVISKTLVRYNTLLSLLSLKNNVIQYIEPGAFEDKNITTFLFENNCLGGEIEKGTFHGTHSSRLDLSGGKLSVIGAEAFNFMHLQYLNLSSNVISKISKAAFKSLKFLMSLDISNNYISEFEVTSLKELSIFKASNNSLQNITKNTFTDVKSLMELDLSRNNIKEIDAKAFADLSNLKILVLSNNVFTGLVCEAFKELKTLTYVDISYTNIGSLKNGSFSTSNVLLYLNVSHSQLRYFEYNAFLSKSLAFLDLSHNLLEHFSINISSIEKVRKFFLNNNKIKEISTESFNGLLHLSDLDLSFNNILQIGSHYFSLLPSLESLNLKFNSDMEIFPSSFNHVSLRKLLLSNNKKRFNFESAIQVSVDFLDLSSCDIENVDLIHVSEINNITYLILRSNRITSIDKKSFQAMSSLSLLDLSLNMISYIQPGTFLYQKNLSELNLHGNNITKLLFGTFEGLSNLKSLNLSSNMIQKFNSDTIRNLRTLKVLSLDDNLIKDLSIQSFADKGINKITIGGNPFFCYDLLNYHYFLRSREINVTASNLDFHSQNINGITCVSGVRETYFPYNRDLALESAINKLSNSIEKKFDTKDVNQNYKLDNVTDAFNNMLEDKITSHLNAERGRIIKEIKSALQKDNDGNYYFSTETGKSDGGGDVRALLYVIVTCLVFILLVCGSVFAYKFLKSGKIFVRQGLLSNSAQHIAANVIEMD